MKQQKKITPPKYPLTLPITSQSILEADFVQGLVDQGIVATKRHGVPQPLSSVRSRIKIKGAPLSETLVQDRGN